MANTTRYRLQYRQDNATTWSTASEAITATSHTVPGLDLRAPTTTSGCRPTATGSTTPPNWGIASATIRHSTGDCEEPVFGSDTYNFEVVETASVGAVIGRVSAADPTINETLTYSIAGSNPGGRFAVNASTGQITVAAALGDPATHTITVKVVDSQSQSDTAIVTITVLENLAPAPANLTATSHRRGTSS